MERTSLIAPHSSFEFCVAPEQPLERIDTFIAKKFPSYSRTFLQKLIEKKAITINGIRIAKSSIMLKERDTIIITFPEAAKPAKIVEKTDFGVTILHTHEHFLVINKPAGLMVHDSQTASGEPNLVDWILANFEEIRNVGAIDRPGIVHRLDKDTSGIMIIPRTTYAHLQFGQMFKDKTIRKTYIALVEGHPQPEGTIDLPIGRHPVLRQKMHAFNPTEPNKPGNTRPSTTHYKVLHHFDNQSLIEAKPVTGRTHQIRVHMAANGHPLVGDQTYGRKSKIIKRHALHAKQIEFEFEGQTHLFSCQEPEDFQQAIIALRNNQ